MSHFNNKHIVAFLGYSSKNAIPFRLFPDELFDGSYLTNQNNFIKSSKIEKTEPNLVKSIETTKKITQNSFTSNDKSPIFNSNDLDLKSVKVTGSVSEDDIREINLLRLKGYSYPEIVKEINNKNISVHIVRRVVKPANKMIYDIIKILLNQKMSPSKIARKIGFDFNSVAGMIGKLEQEKLD